MTTQCIFGFMAPLVRDLRSAVSRLPGVASPNTFDFYSDDYLRYRHKDYIVKIVASQHFFILSINIKATTSGAIAGSALSVAANLTPVKLCLFRGFFFAVNWQGVLLTQACQVPSLDSQA